MPPRGWTVRGNCSWWKPSGPAEADGRATSRLRTGADWARARLAPGAGVDLNLMAVLIRPISHLGNVDALDHMPPV